MKKADKIVIFMVLAAFLSVFGGCSAKKYDINALEEKSKAGESGSSYNGGAGVPLIPVTPVPTPLPKKRSYKNIAVISTYSTTILDRSKGRVNNIKIAAREINGDIVRPGEIFSFNTIVGERTTDEGYREAKIIVNGKAELGTGGGVCQVSSTLYNAASKCGMEIVERNMHPKDVYYVPLGKDATVVYGSLDFKFRNTKDYPVKISVRATTKKVTAKIIKVREF